MLPFLKLKYGVLNKPFFDPNKQTKVIFTDDANVLEYIIKH